MRSTAIAATAAGSFACRLNTNISIRSPRIDFNATNKRYAAGDNCGSFNVVQTAHPRTQAKYDTGGNRGVRGQAQEARQFPLSDAYDGVFLNGGLFPTSTPCHRWMKTAGFNANSGGPRRHGGGVTCPRRLLPFSEVVGKCKPDIGRKWWRAYNLNKVLSTHSMPPELDVTGLYGVGWVLQQKMHVALDMSTFPNNHTSNSKRTSFAQIV